MAQETKMANLFVERTFAHQSYELDIAHGTNDGEHVDINMGGIVDILLENVGRYCERHRNDFLITWESVKSTIEKTTQGDDYIAFGIRRMGVDSNLFLYDRVKSHMNQPGWAENFYRKIFILHIHRVLENCVNGQTYDDIMVITVTLKDVTDDIRVNDLKYVETNISAYNSDIESVINNGTTTFSSDSKSDTYQEYNKLLQTAYAAYDEKQTFQPTTTAAIQEMNHYLTLHEICPSIHSIDSLTAKMEDYRNNPDAWYDTSNINDWMKYCNVQIGLIAAILRIKHEEN